MGKTEFNRFEKFAAGQWEVLFQEAVDATQFKHSGNSKTDVHRKFPGQCQGRF